MTLRGVGEPAAIVLRHEAPQDQAGGGSKQWSYWKQVSLPGKKCQDVVSPGNYWDNDKTNIKMRNYKLKAKENIKEHNY